MERTADPQTQLIVDEAILDYLTYAAIKALLEGAGTIMSSKHSAYLPLQMVGSFLPIFHALHANHTAPLEMSFRLRLLRFTYMFMGQRHLGAASISSATASRHSDSEDHSKTLNSSSSIQGQRQHLSLHETLPSFLALSAVQNALQESTITVLWMRLAAGYMAQVYAEHVLTHHNSRADMLENVFRWSFDPECVAEEGSDEWLINEMFDADADVVDLWENIKNEHIRALCPPEGMSLTTHLEAMVSGRLSVSSFKDKIFEFLMGLLSAHPVPLLAQLEIGKAEGFSPSATEEIKRRAGFT